MKAVVYKIALVVGLSSLLQAASVAQNQLHRVFHHKGIMQGKTSSTLEQGQVVFYFTQEPMVNKGKKELVDGLEKVELLFPHVKLQGLAADDLESRIMSDDGTMLYSVRLEPIAVGVKCTILFNPSLIAMDYDSFLSIQGQHAVRLHFYNKALLDTMRRAGTLLKTTCNKHKPKIVIDCGHGGKDVGAVGHGNIYEKDITLAVGNELARCLQQKGFEVCMVRAKDEFIALDFRTTFANQISCADAFVSIHANACKDAQTSGIETFFLTPGLFKSPINRSPYADVLAAATQALCDASKKLAYAVHSHMVGAARAVCAVHDRQVKQRAAQVLVGTQIPATLVEIGFVSNPTEARMLVDKRYQQHLAQGMAEGIISFCQSKQVS